MHYNVSVNEKLIVKCWAEQMCLEGTTEGWVGVDGTDGGGETVPYVWAGHWEGTPSELRPASFDGGGSSTGGTKLAYIRVGRSKHDKVR